MKLRPSYSSAFSLIEVVIAIGIVAFALVSILGMFGSIANNTRDQIDQRDLLEAVDPLRSYLNTSVPFDQAYEWSTRGEVPKQLVYVSYYIDAQGEPVPTTEALGDDAVSSRGIWLDPEEPSIDFTEYDAARAGSWIKAELRKSLTGNPVVDPWPDRASNYEYGHLVFQVDIGAVELPDLPLDRVNALNTAIGILRNE